MKKEPRERVENEKGGVASNDIVKRDFNPYLTKMFNTKGHGGTIEVKSEEGKGTEFIVFFHSNHIEKRKKEKLNN